MFIVALAVMYVGLYLLRRQRLENHHHSGFQHMPKSHQTRHQLARIGDLSSLPQANTQS
jgi:hypothetical protein